MSLSFYDTEACIADIDIDSHVPYVKHKTSSVSTKSFLKLAVPNILLLTLNYLDEIINTLFIASLGDEVLIAAVGLGNMTLNMIGLSVLFGLGTTLDTLLSQAAGTKNLKICGEYLNQARFVAVIAFILLAVILSFSE